MRIVVTRAVHQAEELAAPLRALGAEVILLPVIGIAPPLDPEPLRQAAANANAYDWIIFTSANAVSAFASHLCIPPQELKARVATVGAATRSVAEGFGFTVSLTPLKYVAESLVDALGAESLEDKRILIPAAAVTRDVVPSELRKLGAEVDVVEAYRNILPPEAEASGRHIFQPPYPDWILFASPSAVDNLSRLIDPRKLASIKIASIGPVTSAAIRAHGLTVTVEANPHTVEGLVQSLMPYNASGTSTQ